MNSKENKVEINNIFKLILEYFNCSIRTFSKDSGISVTTICQVLNGKQKGISKSAYTQLYEYLHISKEHYDLACNCFDGNPVSFDGSNLMYFPILKSIFEDKAKFNIKKKYVNDISSFVVKQLFDTGLVLENDMVKYIDVDTIHSAKVACAMNPEEDKIVLFDFITATFLEDTMFNLMALRHFHESVFEAYKIRNTNAICIVCKDEDNCKIVNEYIKSNLEDGTIKKIEGIEFIALTFNQIIDYDWTEHYS